MTNKHRLLSRQIKKSNLDRETLDKIQPLLDQINSAYKDFDDDIYKLEHILELSNQELYKSNWTLRNDIISKSEAYEKVNKQLDFVINHVGAAIFQLDKYGRMVFLNQTWEDITGLKISNCLNRQFRHFLHIFNKKGKAQIKQMIRGSKNGIFESFELRTPPRTPRKWIKLAINFTYDENKDYSGAIGIIMDISEMKAIENRLRKSEIKERLANNAKNDFLSTMSHEIRTPLNGVIGISHILMMNKYLPSQKKQLHALKITSEHLLNLINNILDFNKIESGNITLNYSDFNINELIDGIKINYRNKAIENNLEFDILKDEELPIFMNGDLTRLHQILHNLLGNAFKFTHHGKIELAITCIQNTNDFVDVQFSISDTGKGIDEQKIHEIFEKFTQENDHITQNYGGTGLGLTICKRLLALMNSELKVKSQLNDGSTFWFKIRFNQAKSQQQISSKNLIENDGFKDLKGLNILVVDDNNINNLVIKQILSKWGVQCTFAVNGQEALVQTKNNIYHLILMDLQMPILNGYDTCLEIRRGSNLNQMTPIIAISASSEVDSIKKAKQVGMDSFMSKPFKPVDLYKIIHHFTI